MIDKIENSTVLKDAVRDLCQRRPLHRQKMGSQVYYDFESNKAVCGIGVAAVDKLDLNPAVFSSHNSLNTTIIDTAIHYIVEKGKVYKHDFIWLKAFQLKQDQGKPWVYCCIYADAMMRNGIEV